LNAGHSSLCSRRSSKKRARLFHHQLNNFTAAPTIIVPEPGYKFCR
jgi:hypothetical protein